MTVDVPSSRWPLNRSQPGDNHGRPAPAGYPRSGAHEAAKILPFRRSGAAKTGDPGIVDPIVHFAGLEERRRMRQNLVAGAIVLAIVVSGLWLIDHLRTGARVMACLEAGHRNCVPLHIVP